MCLLFELAFQVVWHLCCLLLLFLTLLLRLGFILLLDLSHHILDLLCFEHLFVFVVVVVYVYTANKQNFEFDKYDDDSHL